MAGGAGDAGEGQGNEEDEEEDMSVKEEKPPDAEADEVAHLWVNSGEERLFGYSSEAGGGAGAAGHTRAHGRPSRKRPLPSGQPRSLSLHARSAFHAPTDNLNAHPTSLQKKAPAVGRLMTAAASLKAAAAASCTNRTRAAAWSSRRRGGTRGGRRSHPLLGGCAQ